MNKIKRMIKTLVLAVAGMMGLVAQAEDKTVATGEDLKLDAGSGHITVEAGGSVDIANIGANSAYTFTIAGEGVDGKGAIYDSSTDASVTNTIAGLTLSGDATIKTDVAWGVRPSGDGTVAGTLKLEGFTLTKNGADSFVFNQVKTSSDNFTTSTGLFIVEEGSFLLGNSNPGNVLNILVQPGCTFIVAKSNKIEEKIRSKFNVEMRHGTTLHIATNWRYSWDRVPKFTFKPKQLETCSIIGDEADIGGMAHNGTSNRSFTFDTSLLDQTKLPLGETFVFVTNKTSSPIPVYGLYNLADGRYKVADLSDNGYAIKAEILRDPPNVYHYNFDGDTLAEAMASDSGAALPSNLKGGSSPVFENARGNGKAMKINSSNTPLYSDDGAYKVMVKGVTTVISIVKPVATNNFSYVWARGVFGKSAIVAMVIETNAFAVIAWDGPRNGVTDPLTSTNVLARVENIPDFTNKEHFVVFRSSCGGSTLTVDDLPANSTVNVCPMTVGYGGFGVFSKGGGQSWTPATGYSKQNADGFWLNDWQVYDCYLTDREIAKIRSQFWPTGFTIIVR